MKDESASKYRSYSAKSLRYITHSIVNIQIRALSVNSTGVDKFTKPINEILNLETLSGMIGKRITVTILIVADDISDEVHNFLVLF